MNILNVLIKILLRVIVIFCLLYFSLWVLHFIFAYKDVVLSIGAKKVLEGRLTYLVSGTDIKVVELPTGRKKNLYSVPQERKGYIESIGGISFSPDGQRIVFHKMDYLGSGYKYKLYIMNSNGTGSKKILELGDTDIKCPSWSPDGKKIAFILQKPHGQGELYIFEIDNPYVSLQMVSNVRPALYEPTWSPDSNKISFVSDEYITRSIDEKWYSEMFVGRVFIVNYDGTDSRTINADTPVSWSPDGSKLLYRGEEGYYISNEDGSNKRLIVSYKKPFLSMSVGWGSYYPGIWSPDGKYVAFVKQIWPGLCG